MPGKPFMAGLIADLASPDITVHQERCVLVRNCNTTCLRCAEVCTSGCISFDGEKLTISPERCVGCGTCASVCPTCALEAHRPNDDELVDMCRHAVSQTGGTLYIACAQHCEHAPVYYDAEKVVVVECLGRVEEMLLTTMVADGVEDIVLGYNHCDTCMHHTGGQMCRNVVATECELLKAWGSDAGIRLSKTLPEQLHVSEEEAALRAVVGKGRRGPELPAERKVAPKSSDEPETFNVYQYMKVMDDGTLPHFIPDRRERLLDALARIGQPDNSLVQTRLWGHVIVDVDVCMSCRMCATFCPTGAIAKFDEGDSVFGIEHYPGDCVKCRMCTNICPTGALTISDEVHAADMLGGMVDRYEMQEMAVKRSGPHTIWHMAQGFTKSTQVYER